MEWRLFGKEFRTYDTFDNTLFLVKQIAKFIRAPNVSQILSKSEFMENISLIEQQRKAWNDLIFKTEKSLERNCKLGKFIFERKV